MEDVAGTSETKVLTAQSETDPSSEKRESKTWKEKIMNLVPKKLKKKKLDKNKSKSEPCVVPPEDRKDEEKKNDLVRKYSKSCADLMGKDENPREAKNENCSLGEGSSRSKIGNEPKQTNNEKYFPLENQNDALQKRQFKQPPITREQMEKAEDDKNVLLQGMEAEKKSSLFFFYKKDDEEPIGTGSRGTCVFKGRNTNDGREVAIKKIHCYTEKQSSQYKNEIKILLSLQQCQNIVKYLDILAEKDTVYIVLELMEGTLEALVDRPDLEVNFVEMSRDVLTAVQFLHKEKESIVHRDIKPRNILFKSSPRMMLKLADFGLSKLEQSETSSFSGGTRCWMAPEVHKSLSQFFKASDIFSAGLVLHYLMTSKHPFAPKDVAYGKDNRLLVEYEIVHNILHQNLNAECCLPPDALHLIRQMVRHDKNQRPDADKVLAHPFFWSNQKKIKFLQAIANQPGVYEPSSSDFKKDLEMTESGAQFPTVPWSGKSRAMKYLYDEMMTSKKRKYDTSSVADLLRFMRNAIQHVSESGRTLLFQKFVLQDFIFLKEFESLFIEVYEVVLAHGWDQSKLEIMNEMGS